MFWASAPADGRIGELRNLSPVHFAIHPKKFFVALAYVDADCGRS
jgi:hypothetical protein